MSTPLRRTRPEILSPAGRWSELSAAVEAGADAVYFGLKHFTARAKVGFALSELTDVFRVLHARGVKGYVTFNTLVFDHELEEAARALAAIADAGADAIIVQDFGVARLARRVAPGLALHGSTQMTLTSAEGVRVAQSFGIGRVILARELSLEDVRAIRAATDCELEIFVHGALCVSYSGQCFSSEAWGGRSANRGKCAQACRLPYELVVDGETKPLGDARYLLSPGDLYTLRWIPDIVRTGVHGLKIEGRYKDANYVALVTRAYRKAVDDAVAGRSAPPTAREELALEQVYSRGLGPWFLQGADHQAVVAARSPRHRGVRLGRVTAVSADSVTVAPSEADRIAPLEPGDGVVFDAADRRSPEEPEEGGRVYDVRRGPRGVEVSFANGAIDFRRIARGDLLWRSHDPETARLARPYTSAGAPVHRQGVHVRVVAACGEPLETEWMLASDRKVAVTVRSGAVLVQAANRPLTEDVLREQLGRLGNTAYELADLTLEAAGRPFAPVSMLNEVRRDAVAALAARQTSCPPRAGDPAAALAGLRADAAAEIAGRARTEARTPAPATRLHLLVRTPEQLDAALEIRPDSITLDYLDLYGLRPSLERIRDAGLPARVASPRVLKPAEERIVAFLRKLDCGILVRSFGLLDELLRAGSPPPTADFSLNVANVLAARELLRLGIGRITPTHDLNAAQITTLAREVGGPHLEVIAYHHLPVFHTEHCVFCRFLSKGTSYKDCGRPCDTHRLALRDAAGRVHPVMADVGCRNTVFGAEAQEGSRHLEDWQAAGVRDFRLEFAHESAEETRRVTVAFRETLEGSRSPAALSRALAEAAPSGTTEGSFFVPADYRAIPLLS